jgi:hypothetical protein
MAALNTSLELHLYFSFLLFSLVLRISCIPLLLFLFPFFLLSLLPCVFPVSSALLLLRRRRAILVPVLAEACGIKGRCRALLGDRKGRVVSRQHRTLLRRRLLRGNGKLPHLRSAPITNQSLPSHLAQLFQRCSCRRVHLVVVLRRSSRRALLFVRSLVSLLVRRRRRVRRVLPASKMSLSLYCLLVCLFFFQRKTKSRIQPFVLTWCCSDSPPSSNAPIPSSSRPFSESLSLSLSSAGKLDS